MCRNHALISPTVFFLYEITLVVVVVLVVVLLD